MRVADFDFDLPEDLIALEPAPRGAARLLHVRKDGLEDRCVGDLPSLLKRGDMLVLNDTKVIPAQLLGVRPAREGAQIMIRPPSRSGRGEGGPTGLVNIDVTLHKHVSDAPDGARWTAFVRPAKRVKEGDVLDFGAGLAATVESRRDAEAALRFNLSGGALDAALLRSGKPPLPPYIARKRETRADDVANYQTVFASEPGSVAAPTAGLHFTDELFGALARAGVERETITLHVGAGTFLPVTAEDTNGHIMHAEWGEITSAQAEAINAARAAGGRIVAVGTTSLRLLESAADRKGHVRAFKGETAIFITPGYKFRAVDLLMTNFHLPRSTLFMLVCAFAGAERMKAAYAYAMEKGYRFFSYGDASLLELNP
jgi:S-adenosylmethionine:tRNA ribosyltransferase-isomerase